MGRGKKTNLTKDEYALDTNPGTCSTTVVIVVTSARSVTAGTTAFKSW